MYLFRSILSAPLRWFGLWKEHNYVVSIKLFNKYIDQRDIPFTGINLTLKPRSNGDAGPQVLSAIVRVHLRVGILRRLLYHIRPYTLLALAMGAGALCAAIGGSIAATAFIILLAYVLLWEKTTTSSPQGQARVDADVDMTVDDSDSDLLAGDSTDGGQTPRDLELSDDEELQGEGEEIKAMDSSRSGASSGGNVPERSGPGSNSSSLYASPREERPWQHLLKQLPMQGSPAPGDDTPYVGSEVERTLGMGSGRTELGGGGIRLRTSKQPPT